MFCHIRRSGVFVVWDTAMRVQKYRPGTRGDARAKGTSEENSNVDLDMLLLAEVALEARDVHVMAIPLEGQHCA
jgi:hypothetical protein